MREIAVIFAEELQFYFSNVDKHQRCCERRIVFEKDNECIAHGGSRGPVIFVRFHDDYFYCHDSPGAFFSGF